MQKIGNNFGKIPPQAIDIEEAIISAIIIDSNSILKVIDILKPEAFYKDSNQKIYSICCELYENQKSIDLFTVTEKLRSKGILDEIGGIVYITSLTGKVVSSSHIQYHASIIKDKYLRRKMIEFSYKLNEKAYDETIDTLDIAEDIENNINNIVDENLTERKSFKAIKKESEFIYGNNYEKPPYCLFVNGNGIFTLSNFSVIIGKAKSRKSTFLSMVLSSFVSGNMILSTFESKAESKILYFDTEQSKFFINRLVNISMRLGDIKLHPDNLEVYSLRPYLPKERVKFIEDIINENENITYIIIDGIRDLISDINSAEEATYISSKLMKWSAEKNCHISCILHQNKTDFNARGHIGTELMNKSETVLSVNKTNEGSTSIVKCEYVRGASFNDIEFGIDSNGLPYISSSRSSSPNLDDYPF